MRRTSSGKIVDEQKNSKSKTNRERPKPIRRFYFRKDSKIDELHKGVTVTELDIKRRTPRTCVFKGKTK